MGCKRVAISYLCLVGGKRRREGRVVVTEYEPTIF